MIQTITKPQTFSDKDFVTIIGLSSDCLVLLNDDYTPKEYLIEGNDKSVFILEGALDLIQQVISLCYEAVETNSIHVFEIDNHTIIFNKK